MKIIRHTARDMRQALRAVREQLGEDAVILSSRKTSEGVEVTAIVRVIYALSNRARFSHQSDSRGSRLTASFQRPHR